MKKIWFFMIGLCLSVMIAVQANAQWFIFQSPLLGKQARDFSLTSLSGATKSLSSLRNDKASIIFFWATWCPHCRNWISQLGNQIDAFKAKDIELILVDVQEGPGSVRRYLKRKGIDYDVLLDKTGDIASEYGVQGIPTFVLIGPDGIVKAVENVLPEDYEQLLKK